MEGQGREGNGRNRKEGAVNVREWKGKKRKGQWMEGNGRAVKGRKRNGKEGKGSEWKVMERKGRKGE